MQVERLNSEKAGVQLFPEKIEGQTFLKKLNADFFEVQFAHLHTARASTQRPFRVACTLLAVKRSSLDCTLQCGMLVRNV